MTKIDPRLARQLGDQILLDRLGGFGFGQSHPGGKPFHVGIDDDSRWNSIRRPQHDVRGFAADPWEFCKSFEIARNFASMKFDELARRGDEVFRFGAKETGRSDQLFNIGKFGFREFKRRRKSLEQRGGYLIHSNIGALRREDRRDEELEGV